MNERNHRMIAVEIENVLDYYVNVRNHLTLVVVDYHIPKILYDENEVVNLLMNYHSMLELFEEVEVEI